jgi:hypothetical protein
MKKEYEAPKLLIVVAQEDVIKTSAGKDTFDDNYQDFGDGN